MSEASAPIALPDYYADLAELSRIFDHPVVQIDGVLRWKKNWLIDSLLPPHGPVCMNRLRIDFLSGKFSLEEYMRFYMQAGYSLCGFAEVFGQCEATEFNVEYVDPIPEGFDTDNQYWETPIANVIKRYVGAIYCL